MRRTSRGKIVGRSMVMREVLETLDRVARADTTVLVSGETGTGKEALVAALHDASARRRGPLVAVNCGALPEHLIESELFGHVRGAFTGAVRTSSGRVAEAEGGTLFLDEIGELPLPLQVKILRLLQQREYRPVGGSRTMHANVRFAAATNEELADLVAAGRFRPDLFYRLAVVHLRLPPLRDRAEDIAPLVEHFLALAAETGGTGPVAIAPEALAALEQHSWPGNVRELENVVQRAALLEHGSTLTLESVACQLREASCSLSSYLAPAPSDVPPEGIDFRAACRAYERRLIVSALERTAWNRTRAAELLHLSRSSLVEMMKRLRITDRTQVAEASGGTRARVPTPRGRS